MNEMNNNQYTCAERVNQVEEYYFSRKLREVAQMKAAGIDVISLGIGSPDMPPSTPTIETLCEEAKKEDAHGYQPYTGIPQLRQGFADFYQQQYGVTLQPENEILPLIGSKEGILHITLALVNPGEKVLVPNPGYPTYTSLSRLLGAEVIHYDLTEECQWMPDFEQLEKLDLSDVKLMWTNYPHMPTGKNATTQLYAKLVDFGRRNNIIIVNDNPYSMILNDNPLSIMQIEGAKDGCIELNSMSKSHNMPGWRLGMIATNPTFLNWIIKVKSNIDSGMFRPLQLAAAKALHNLPEWHEEMNIKVYKRRRELAQEIMKVLQCTYDDTQVGMFLWGKLPDHVKDVQKLVDELLQEAHVFITPGFIFGTNGSRYIRLSLCCKEYQLQQALQRVKNYCNRKI